MPEVIYIGGGSDLRIIRTVGKVHVSWVEQHVRQLFTVDEDTAEAVDQLGWNVIASDARILEGMLRCLPDQGGGLGRRVWERYRDVHQAVRLHTNGVPADIAALFRLPVEAFGEFGPHRVPALDSPPAFDDAELDEYFFGRGSGRYYDRELRAISQFEFSHLLGRPHYGRIERTHVADRLPPFLNLDVSTTWMGANTMPSGEPPRVFETLLFANTRPTRQHPLAGKRWLHKDAPEAAAFHAILVRAVVAEHTSDAVLLPVRHRGRKRDAKPYKRMSARLRRFAQQEFQQGSSGSRRLRGRHGQPDRWVHWTWNAEKKTYDVRLESDPVLTPAPGAAAYDRRRRARAHRGRRKR